MVKKALKLAKDAEATQVGIKTAWLIKFRCHVTVFMLQGTCEMTAFQKKAKKKETVVAPSWYTPQRDWLYNQKKAVAKDGTRQSLAPLNAKQIEMLDALAVEWRSP